MVRVVLGPSMRWLGEQLEGAVRRALPGSSVVWAQHKEFPDGEAYVRVPAETLKEERVLVVQTISSPQDRSFIQLLLLVDACVRLGAGGVEVFAPYLAYSRQDKVFLRGEPVSIEVLLRALRSAGARALYTIDVHSPDVLTRFEGRAVNMVPANLLAERLAAEGREDVVVVAPDKGALERARAMAFYLGAEYVQLEKRRDRVTGEVTVYAEGLEVRGRRAVIVDDIISTGGTIALAASALYGMGAREVIAACSHALMVGDSSRRLRESGVRRVLALNTLPPREGVEYVDVYEWAFRRMAEEGP